MTFFDLNWPKFDLQIFGIGIHFQNFGIGIDFQNYEIWIDFLKLWDWNYNYELKKIPKVVL